ncbi:MAG: hypothetical protein R3B90_01125 [Planctomycetaceae bacterium]
MKLNGWRIFGGAMSLVIAGGCGSILLSLAGCGGNSEPTQQQQPAAPAAGAGTSPATAQPAAAPQPSVAVAPQSNATRWVGGIPYDVFYDRPLEVAANQTTIGGAAPVAVATTQGTMTAPDAGAATTPVPPANAASTTASAAPSAGGAAGDLDWASVAPIEIVNEEIGNIRNELQTKLNTLGDYNKNWEIIGVDATALAALAGVVEAHPGSVSWKEQAKVARELAAQINANAAKTGRSAYDATKAPFDGLVDLLSGNPAPEVEAEANAPFADYADRGVLMARLESTLAHLKANINTEARMKESPAEVKRKLTLLSALMAVVTTEGYDYIAEPQYQGFAKTFVDAAVSGREAVEGENFAAYSEALNVMQKTCNDCHLKYAFGGDSF